MSYERDTPPSRLYKYQPFSSRTLTSLKTRCLWFGRPSAFNDPFDCVVPFRVAEVTEADCLRLLASPDFREDFSSPRLRDASGRPTDAFRKLLHDIGDRAFRDKAAESYHGRGVTCFSQRPTDTLLWSHYGGGHRGICLEFDTSSPVLGKLHRVRYTDTIPQLRVVDELVGDGDMIMELLLTKAECWSYEEEWRAIHIEANKEYCYGIEALTGVYLGAALTPDEKDLVCHIIHGSPTALWEVYRTDTSFRLQARKVDYTPFTYGTGEGGDNLPPPAPVA